MVGQFLTAYGCFGPLFAALYAVFISGLATGRGKTPRAVLPTP